MTYLLESGKEAHLTIDIEIDQPQSAVWHFLATTEGITQWFPQLRADDLPEAGKLTFVDTDYEEEMPLLEFVEEAILSYSWGRGRVIFSLNEFEPNKTVVHFQEFLPYDFENMAQDMAGWTMQMEHLKAVAEAVPYEFDQALFEKRKAEFTSSLSERLD